MLTYTNEQMERISCTVIAGQAKADKKTYHSVASSCRESRTWFPDCWGSDRWKIHKPKMSHDMIKPTK